MIDDEIETLRARSETLSGAARAPVLHELGQALAMRYWRAGPGSPAGLPDLQAAIVAFQEGTGHLDRDDSLRGPLVGQLGWLIGLRYIAHGGAENDRETAIGLLEESLGSALPPALRDSLRVVLGQLYLGRVTRALRSPDTLMTALRNGSGTPIGSDADRAADCFRRVLRDGPATAEMAETARTMLELAEAVQSMTSGFGARPGEFDLSRLMGAVQGLQRIQERARAGAAGGGSVPSIFDAEDIAARGPLDRPVAVVHGPEPAAPARPRPRRPEPVPADRDGLRRALRDKIVRGADLYLALAYRLRPDAPPPETHLVDEWVATATLIVHAGGTTVTDHLLLAAGLYLRARTGTTGDAADDDAADDDAADDDAADDRRAAGESLLATADGLPGEPPGVVAVAVELAGLLDQADPAGRVTAGLAAAFAGVVRAMRAAGADALAVPRPGGMVLLDAATGGFEVVDSAVRLPARLLVTGRMPVPPGESIVSSVATAAQVVELAGRTAVPLTQDPVFVADPCDGRESATVDTILTRRRFYPRSTGLGRTAENVDGAGTPAEVLARLDASMLYLGCDVTADGALRLAGPAELAPATIAARRRPDPTTGGLAVLPPVGPGFAPLADALLTAGFTGVIGWLRPVPQPVASLALFVLQAKLVEDRADPADAVRQVRRWLADPARATVPDLPAGYAATLAYADLANPMIGSALVHRGI